MTAQPAFLGYLKLGANTVQLVNSADLAAATKVLDTTSIGGTSGAETSIVGTIGAKVTLKAAYDMTDTTGQLAIRSAFWGRTLLSGTVFSPDNVKTYTFSCWVTDYHPSAPVQDKATLDVTLLPTGVITPA